MKWFTIWEIIKTFARSINQYSFRTTWHMKQNNIWNYKMKNINTFLRKCVLLIEQFTWRWNMCYLMAEAHNYYCCNFYVRLKSYLNQFWISTHCIILFTSSKQNYSSKWELVMVHILHAWPQGPSILKRRKW